jgi:hypothetical protein
MADIQTKYLQMLEEKTGLFRSIDSKKRELSELDAYFETLLIKAQELEEEIKKIQTSQEKTRQESAYDQQEQPQEEEEDDLVSRLPDRGYEGLRRDRDRMGEDQSHKQKDREDYDDEDEVVVVDTPARKNKDAGPNQRRVFSRQGKLSASLDSIEKHALLLISIYSCSSRD